ncbi:hypothetical protein N027_11620 [Pseudomonas syringae USA007]|uniref:MotA/TolQ/ExbB proton channel domain-containing protein n=1 Tax=Pseudomonas syringae USA007 TaxID=1357288 RepID=A0AAU8MGS2_PSESX|nr:hypothetical protein [Pseudomonas syringae]
MMRIDMFKVKKTRPKLNVVARASRELALAFALGGVPVLLNSESSAQFKAMLDLLLAAPFLMGYYAWLCLAFSVAAIVKYKWRFMSARYQRWLDAVHLFLGDIGGSFLTAGRTGLGAILGFLTVWHWVEPDSVSAENITRTLVMVVGLTLLSVMLALGEEMFKDPKQAAASK